MKKRKAFLCMENGSPSVSPLGDVGIYFSLAKAQKHILHYKTSKYARKDLDIVQCDVFFDPKIKLAP